MGSIPIQVASQKGGDIMTNAIHSGFGKLQAASSAIADAEMGTEKKVFPNWPQTLIDVYKKTYDRYAYVNRH